MGIAKSDLATGYFLTDGYINLAILKFKNDHAAYTEGAPRYEGLHHFGFKVDDLEEARKNVEEAGATFEPLGGKATGQGVVESTSRKMAGWLSRCSAEQARDGQSSK